jgi:cytochrome c oxidase subunit III
MTTKSPEIAETEPGRPVYQLIDPSPWPIRGAFSALLLASGLIIWVYGLLWPPWIVFSLGVLGVAGTMIGWWRDVVREGEDNEHTPLTQLSLHYGMLLFIGSEIMFFVAWFWAFFNSALFPADPIQVVRDHVIGGVWPPQGIMTSDPWGLPLLMTAILLSSAGTVTWAHARLLKGDRRGLKIGLTCTVLLGILFTCVQAYEFTHAHFNYSGNIYGAVFFMATGFHGAHVIIGTIFLGVCLLRAFLGQFTPTEHLGLIFAAWYWHFVDVVWLLLFAFIYVWWA